MCSCLRPQFLGAVPWMATVDRGVAVRQLMVSARAGLFGAVDWIEQTSNLTTNVSA